MENLEKKQNLIRALEKAIESEKHARENYLRLAEKAEDPETRAMLEQLAQWEAGHRQMLEDRVTTLKML